MVLLPFDDEQDDDGCVAIDVVNSKGGSKCSRDLLRRFRKNFGIKNR